MRRLTVFVAVLATVLVPATLVTGAATGNSRPLTNAPQLVAFHGFHLGGGTGFGRRHSLFGGSGGRGSSHVLRRVAHALAFAYFLHLFFSHGGLSILLWLLVVGLVVHFLRRRHSRRRYA